MSKTKIEALLNDAFAPDELYVTDDSHKHAGHVGATQGGHFSVTIKSSAFDGKTHLEKHRMIYKVLEPIKSTIHALAIKVLMALFVMGVSTTAHADLKNGLVLWYKFNETSGNAIDSSGNNNNGTPTGTTIESNCIRGGCRGFNGSDYVTAASAPSASSTDSMTYSIWLKPSGYSNGGASDGSGTYFFDRTSATQGLYSLKAVSGQFSYQSRNDGGSNLQVISTTSGITLNVWTHIVMVREYGVSFRIYKNAVVEGSTATGAGSAISPPRITVGASVANGSGYVNGFIDDLRIYNRALSTQEIADLYRSGAVIKNAVLRNARINQ